MQFEITTQSNKSRARLGVLKTPHGEVETPCLVPVATQASVKTLTSEEVLTAGFRLLICNTFHLHLKPGEDIVHQAGQLHRFMNWPHSLMTDSGGFQVFSLGFGRDHGVGKILREPPRDERSKFYGEKHLITSGQQPKNVRITDDGVTFTSPLDGKKIFLGPKESIAIQQKLGADIIFAFDEATSPVADASYTETSLARTHRWAEQSLAAKTSSQAIYGIVQGGKFKHLRQASAQFIGRLPFDGFGLGGEYGDDKTKMIEMITTSLDELPTEKPRHLLGIGHLEDIPEIIRAGIDTFDCIVPTHYARHGTAFTSEGRLDLTKTKFLRDQNPLDPTCHCPVCEAPWSPQATLRGTAYKRSYLAHLVRAKEITGLKLLTLHNLYFFNTYIASLRTQIKSGEL